MGSGPCDMCNIPEKIEGYGLTDYNEEDVGHVYLCYHCVARLQELAKTKFPYRIRIHIDYYQEKEQ